MTRREFMLAPAPLVFLGGCGIVGSSTATNNETRVHLVDVSGSVINKRSAYEEGFKKLTDCIQPGTRTIVDFITDNPLSDASHSINEPIPVFDPVMDNRLRFSAKLKQTKQNLTTQFNKLLQGHHQAGQTTPIIDSLSLAERIFARYPSTQKRLVVFSDMLEDSGRADFDVWIPSPDAIIRTLKAERAQPTLSGVQVIVIGASASSTQGYQEVERFWRELFKALGATLTEYGSGLIDCP